MVAEMEKTFSCDTWRSQLVDNKITQTWRRWMIPCCSVADLHLRGVVEGIDDDGLGSTRRDGTWNQGRNRRSA